MAGTKGKSGGARPNAGPKTKAEKHETAIEVAERRCADRLPLTLSNLEELADGGTEESEDEYAAAGMVCYEDFETTTDQYGNERITKIKRQLFPDLPPDELVLVKRKIKKFGPDVKANIYLSDRVMGKPSDGDEAKIHAAVEAALHGIFGKLQQILPASDFQRVSEAFANDSGGGH